MADRGQATAVVLDTGPIHRLTAPVRLAERASPGELLVSLAVRDLVADSGLALVPAVDNAYRPALPTSIPPRYPHPGVSRGRD